MSRSAADLGGRRLYGIVDLGYVSPEQAEARTGQLIRGGVEIIQLRAKERQPDELLALGARLRSITAEAGVVFIVNDHVALAARLNADGVHLGQEDGPLAAAREGLDPGKLIGRSTHSLDQAMAAEQEGADYIGFGPLFATPTKPAYPPVGLGDIQRVNNAVKLPVFCIGGIKLENLPSVVAAGARRVVVVSGLLQAENPVEYARAARRLLL